MGLDWKHKDDFNAAEEHDWKGAGLARTSNGLTFLQVYDAGEFQTNGRACVFVFVALHLLFTKPARIHPSFKIGSGHMVPTDQPENSLDMLKTFLAGGAF